MDPGELKMSGTFPPWLSLYHQWGIVQNPGQPLGQQDRHEDSMSDQKSHHSLCCFLDLQLFAAPKCGFQCSHTSKLSVTFPLTLTYPPARMIGTSIQLSMWFSCPTYLLVPHDILPFQEAPLLLHGTWALPFLVGLSPTPGHLWWFRSLHCFLCVAVFLSNRVKNLSDSPHGFLPAPSTGVKYYFLRSRR